MKRLVLPLIACLLLGNLVVFNAKADAKSTYHREILPNGLTVLIKSNPDSRVFAVNILAKGRSLLEPDDKAGISEFVNRMLTKGTKSYTSEKLARSLDNNGIKLTLVDNPYIPYDDRYTSRAFAFVKMETIDEFANASLGLLAEIIVEPTFPDDKIEEVRNEIIGVLGMDMGSTYKNADRLFYQELLPGNPLSKTILGNMRSVGSITKNDLVDFHKMLYAPKNLILAVATNIPPEKLMSAIKLHFGNMQNPSFEYPVANAPAAIKEIVSQHQQMEKDQIYIYLGNITPGIGDPSYPALIIATAALSTRMGLELREKQGLAYSVGSSISLFPGFGIFSATMGTGYKNYEKALSGIQSEIAKISTAGITDEERTNTTNSLWGSILTRDLSRINQAYYMALYEYLGVGYQYWDEFIDDLRAVTTQQVRQTAEKYLPQNSYVLATVGKK